MVNGCAKIMLSKMLCKCMGRMHPFSQCMAEPEIEHQACAGESKRKRHPHSWQSQIKDETKDVAGWQRYHKVGNEGEKHHGLNVGYATQGVCIVALHAVANLIKDKRYGELCNEYRHASVIGKYGANLIAQGEHGNGCDYCHESD